MEKEQKRKRKRKRQGEKWRKFVSGKKQGGASRKKRAWAPSEKSEKSTDKEFEMTEREE